MTKLCGECGMRTVAALTVAGRHAPFKNFPALEIPESVAIPTCSNCGTEWIDRKTAAALDSALANEAAKVLSSVARKAIEFLGVILPQRDLEAGLGLSAGYLSKVRHNKETPSAALAGLLALLASHPAQTEEIKRLWETGQVRSG